MIHEFYHFLILAGEFTQHAIIIVLIGFVLVEYIILAMERSSSVVADLDSAVRLKKRVLIALFLSVFLFIWAVAEFFSTKESELLELLEYGAVIFSLAIIAYFIYQERSKLHRLLFFTVVATYVIYFFLEFMPYAHNLNMAYQLIRSVIFILVYFFILDYFIVAVRGKSKSIHLASE